jgi:uncharacterized protein (TIGR04255 family)
MANNQLDFLKPFSEKNAIEEVVFMLYFDNRTPISKPPQYKKLHEGDFQKDFPKFETLALNSFTLNQFGVQSKSNILENGFTFEQYKPNGGLLYRMRGELGLPEQGEGSWIAINILDYESWTIESDRAYRWLNKILDVEDQIDVKAISLHYIDTFIWESETKLPFNEIFNADSEYKPKKINDEALRWQSSMSYDEVLEDNSLTTQLKISMDHNIVNQFKRIRIENPLKIDYKTSIEFKSSLPEKIIEDFKYLHDKNKKVMKDILTKEVCKKIDMEVDSV